MSERELAEERATVEKLKMRIERIKMVRTEQKLESLGGTPELLEKPIENSISENQNTMFLATQTEKRNSEGKVKSPDMREIHGVLSRHPLDSSIDAKSGGFLDRKTWTGSKDNVTHAMHSQTSRMPLLFPSKPLSSLLPFPLNSSPSS